LARNPDGSDTWQFRDIVVPNVALNAVAGRPKKEYGPGPRRSVTHITREHATVGALRKAAEGHYGSIQGLSKYEHGGGGLKANSLPAQLDRATAPQK
jgi:hypothetical protein